MPETFPTFSLTSRKLKPILRQISVIVPGTIEIPVSCPSSHALLKSKPLPAIPPFPDGFPSLVLEPTTRRDALEDLCRRESGADF